MLYKSDFCSTDLTAISRHMSTYRSGDTSTYVGLRRPTSVCEHFFLRVGHSHIPLRTGFMKWGVGTPFYRRMGSEHNFIVEMGSEPNFIANPLSQEHISCPRSISAVQRAYQLSKGNISCPNAISALLRAYQLSQGNIRNPKSTPDFPRRFDFEAIPSENDKN